MQRSRRRRISAWIATVALLLLPLATVAVTQSQDGLQQDDPSIQALPLVSVAGSPGAPGSEFLDNLYLLRDSQAGRASGNYAIPPQQSLVIGPLSGPGVIRHLWFTLQDNGPLVMRELVLRIFWDDEEVPSVESPWGDFFGVGHGKVRFLNTLPLVMIPPEDGTLAGPGNSAVSCYFPMPFYHAARIEIENPTERTIGIFYHVDYEQVPWLPPNVGYFHAHWRRESPVQEPTAYTVLEAEGEGAFVGLVWSIIPLASGSWVEGHENLYIDGDLTATISGTGMEDYFGQSWGFRTETGSMYSGTSLGPLGDPFGPTSAYRFHLLDPVRFQSSLRVELLNRGWDPGQGGWYWRQDDFATVAYWYQREPHRPFEPLPGLAARIAGLDDLPCVDLGPTAGP